MPSRVSLEWNGDRLLQELEDACAAAIDDVTADTAREATVSHWWRDRTSYLARHIETTPARTVGARVIGSIGTTYSGQKGVKSAFYALFLEYRLPWFRPAADAIFPTLAARIRERFSR